MQMQLVQNRYSPPDDYALEHEPLEEEHHGIVELQPAEEELPGEGDAAGSCAEVMAVYLDDVKKLPLLSREEERALAQEAHEAEALKNAATAEWLLLFAGLVSGKKIAAGDTQNTRIQPKVSLRELLQTLQAAGKKSRRRGSIVALARAVNLRVLYRDGTIARLAAVVNLNPPAPMRRRLLGILRQFVQHEKKARQCRKRLAQSLLRFVVSIAKHYRNRGMPLSDLIQEGNIGLLRALEKFDYRRGYRLSTYAGWWIRQGIVRALDNQALTIRVPVYVNEKVKKLRRQKHAVQVTAEEGPDNAVYGQDELMCRAMQVMQEPLSLDGASAGYTRSRHECIPDMLGTSASDREIAGALFAEKTKKIFQCLSAVERTVICMRFGLGHESSYTLEEIGTRFSLTRERVRQIEKAALHKIRRAANVEQLKPFWDECVGS